jgi:hypothetical protein
MDSFGGPQILKWKNGMLSETAIQRVFGTRQSKVSSFHISSWFGRNAMSFVFCVLKVCDGEGLEKAATQRSLP